MLVPGVSLSATTETQFRFPFVTQSCFSSGERAALLGFAPVNPFRLEGRRGLMTWMVSTIAFVVVSTTSTVSDWSSTT